MKQLFIIAMVLVYSLASSGYTLNVHYCCGKIDSISWEPSRSSSCKHGTAMKDGPCCADRSVHLDVDDSVPSDQVTAPDPVMWILPGFLIQPAFPQFVQEPAHIAFFSDSSPPAEPPLTILHCRFRI